MNRNLRIALALALVAVTLATAVYIHQRHTWTNGFSGGTSDNPLLGGGTAESVRSHPSWADPTAVLLAIGGVAVAFLIVGSAPRKRGYG